MCLATAMVNKSGTETVLAKNISKISIEGDNIVMVDILGEEFTVEGTLISADLVNGVVKIQAA
ncbi:MAG: CooT family nickel-binding protein [Oscillospiraceae bacterium]|nr:CooT family nickel-binding protein [Oscillospiraceae bacterium]